MTVLVHKGILVQWDTSPSGCGTDDITYDTGTLVLSPDHAQFWWQAEDSNITFKDICDKPQVFQAVRIFPSFLKSRTFEGGSGDLFWVNHTKQYLSGEEKKMTSSVDITLETAWWTESEVGLELCPSWGRDRLALVWVSAHWSSLQTPQIGPRVVGLWRVLGFGSCRCSRKLSESLRGKLPRTILTLEGKYQLWS